ncbi:MAG: hypothetical protein IJ952_07745, partial [Alistipes sp.]|nr:hypothetical protein [Alistipes sp.]
NKGKLITWADIKKADFGDNFDTEWVEFYPSEALCAYPTGNENLMKTVDFLNWIKLQKQNNVTKLSVVAFINEYFYSVNPFDKKTAKWQDFVNKEDRVMRILQKPDISKDGHSISTKALCSFTQRSIRTVFNTNVTSGTIFGLETYDETGALTRYGEANSYSSNIIDEAMHGYGSDGQPNGNVYNALKKQTAQVWFSQVEFYPAANACQQRNRAGSDNVWKLATESQYTAIWLGEVALPNYAKLYQGNPADNITSAPGWSTNYNQVYQHWVNGGRIFWHVEGAAFSPKSYSNASAHFARCVRELGSGNTVKIAEAKTVNGTTFVVSNNFTDGAYRGIATENLPIHHERDAANKMTKAFVVAKNNLEATWTAVGDAPAVPQILSAEVKDGNLVIKFLEKDTYVYATDKDDTDNMNNVVLGAENSFVINNPSGGTTYYFRAKRNYNTYSQYVTVNADGTYSNTAGGSATNSYSISAQTSATTDIPMMAAMNQDLCAQYTKESANGTAWRVPNQKEMLLMKESKALTGNDTGYHTSTLFSARNLATTANDGRYGFTWYDSSNFGLKPYNQSKYVRCVRDASEAELQSLGISNSGDQEDGGEA